MVFCSCYYISNPIPTTLGPSQKSQQSFHTLFGLPIFTIEPWSTLLYSLLSDFVCFVLWLSSVSKRDMDMSSALFGSRAICSVASLRVFVNTLDLTIVFWKVRVRLSCQTSFVTTVAWSAVARAPCWCAVFRVSDTGMRCDSTRGETWTCTILDSGKSKDTRKIIVIHAGPTV